MEKRKLSEVSIAFIGGHVEKETLLSLLPLNEDSVYDLIHELETGIEVPLAQDEEEGKAIDHDVLDGCVSAIDELNDDPDYLDYEDFNARLASFLKDEAK